jgi:hypothetical protein
MRNRLYQIRLKREDLGTPQTPAEGWLPSALPLLMITLHADGILIDQGSIVAVSHKTFKGLDTPLSNIPILSGFVAHINPKLNQMC